MRYGVIFLVLCVVLAPINGYYDGKEGDPCEVNGKDGVCVNLRHCTTALEQIKHLVQPKICGFQNQIPVVCCFDSAATTTAKPTPLTTAKPKMTTKAYVPPTYDYRIEGSLTPQTCEPLSLNRTSKKTGRKAWDKCIQYQEELIYPCEKGVDLLGSVGRGKHCYHNADELVVGGEDAGEKEFRHMALLGYGADANRAQWLCGGALISERFILTAGHCTYSRGNGAVTFARLALLRRSDPIRGANAHVYSIKSIKAHPEYKAPEKYNDIALLETTTDVRLGDNVVPACIDIGNDVAGERAIATGWGLIKYKGDESNVLQKVKLTKFDTLECMVKNPPGRNLDDGLRSDSQVCYGDHTESKDTCQGDSGGPLQVTNTKIHCMYTIVGVTSFGKGCGFIGEPGVYTKVAQYADWIESIVWR